MDRHLILDEFEDLRATAKLKKLQMMLTAG